MKLIVHFKMDLIKMTSLLFYFFLKKILVVKGNTSLVIYLFLDLDPTFPPGAQGTLCSTLIFLLMSRLDIELDFCM